MMRALRQWLADRIEKAAYRLYRLAVTRIRPPPKVAPLYWTGTMSASASRFERALKSVDTESHNP